MLRIMKWLSIGEETNAKATPGCCRASALKRAFQPKAAVREEMLVPASRELGNKRRQNGDCRG
jgi:hypothetical protein